jgi:hypothetical protein
MFLQHIDRSDPGDTLLLGDPDDTAGADGLHRAFRVIAINVGGLIPISAGSRDDAPLDLIHLSCS